MKQSINILIADDFPLFLEGIELMLKKEPQIHILGSAIDGEELLKKVGELKPDVVITDIEMPVMNGIKVTKEIKNNNPATKVIALTMFGEEYLIVDMLDAGADGYLLKNSKKEELIEAIASVMEGGNYFCNSTTLKLSRMIAARKQPAKEVAIKFSEKEMAIIQLICEQYASKQIASATQLTHRTVEKYRDNIMEKTGAKNVVGIVIYAIRNGLFKP
jgi:DNA-binding NarL/FixJ family response regulator